MSIEEEVNHIITVADLKQNARRILSQPETLELICAHVANGGDLADLCDTWEAQFSSVHAWLYNDDARKEQYTNALLSNGAQMDNVIMRQLKQVATSDIRDLFNDQGLLINLKDLPAEIAACIQSVEVTEEFEGSGKDKMQIGWTHKIKFWDKLKALELLGRHRGLLIEKVKVEGTITIEDLILGRKAK